MRARLAKLALGAAALLVAAGCGSTSPTSSGTSTTASGTSTTASRTATTSGSGTSTTGGSGTSTTASGTSTTVAEGSQFVPIVEPFDPGHPAVSKPGPASCTSASTTLAIEQCLENRTESADAAIDAVQAAKFAGSTAAGQSAIAEDDAAWLAARGPVCSVAFHSGGTIDGIDVANCLLAESTARLDLVRGVNPPESVLSSTDDIDPSAYYWYTAPDGSRIAELDTQGDATGGVIIAWMVIAGPVGFVVQPGQFVYQDGSFTDPGIVEPPNPAGHQVATGVEYTFGIDYSRLSQDPDETHREGEFTYAPSGTPVAVWK